MRNSINCFFCFLLFCNSSTTKRKSSIRTAAKRTISQRRERKKEAQIQAHTNKTLLESCLNDADESYINNFRALCREENQNNLSSISLHDLVNIN